MSALKKYVKMFLTAVICFAMCLIPGKKAKAAVKKAQAGGQTAVSGKGNGRVCSESAKNALFAAENDGVVYEPQKREEGVKKANIRCLGPGDSRVLIQDVYRGKNRNRILGDYRNMIRGPGKKNSYAIRRSLLLMT